MKAEKIKLGHRQEIKISVKTITEQLIVKLWRKKKEARNKISVELVTLETDTGNQLLLELEEELEQEDSGRGYWKS